MRTLTFKCQTRQKALEIMKRFLTKLQDFEVMESSFSPEDQEISITVTPSLKIAG